MRRREKEGKLGTLLLGTPFGPYVSAPPGDRQDEVRARLAGKLGGSAHGVAVRTVANLALSVK